MDSFLRETLEPGDTRVWGAIRSVREYSLLHAADSINEQAWWRAFGTFYAGLSHDLSSSQCEALEMATDALLANAGLQTWTVAKASLGLANVKAATE